MNPLTFPFLHDLHIRNSTEVISVSYGTSSTFHCFHSSSLKFRGRKFFDSVCISELKHEKERKKAEMVVHTWLKVKRRHRKSIEKYVGERAQSMGLSSFWFTSHLLSSSTFLTCSPQLSPYNNNKKNVKEFYIVIIINQTLIMYLN